ncbi:histone H2A-Bbd type 1 [Cricetulus griseus]|uniref:Histone H2A n=1 Tax=Cricetulus griseus TaxID=10029 RepID=G3HY87_CRIGR|nr:histone H2A-Bbd type 1 [Cricetulus griseus]XP_027289055.1 histone H2A-Bbd type 1 [Cricetulus griseus]EGW02413.1 Histone H2A-Bbd type 2/3 [Cricetulus griseus]ERE65439.1 histone H2A-Bbd type 2/3-like protein [Cricetulus griseus]
MEEKKRKETISRITRGQLQFSLDRIERFFRDGNFSQRLSASAPVFLAGVLEFLTSNILDLAGREAHANGTRLITPEHVTQVVQNNDQLREVFKEHEDPVVSETPEPEKN